jgi:hypothetical protein
MRAVHVLKQLGFTKEEHLAAEHRMRPNTIEQHFTKLEMVWDTVNTEGCDLLYPDEWFLAANRYLHT